MENKSVISMLYCFIILILSGNITSEAKDIGDLNVYTIKLETMRISNRSLFPYTKEEEGQILWGLMNERGWKVIKPAYKLINTLKSTDEFYLLSEDKVQILDRTKNIIMTFPKDKAARIDYYNGYLKYGRSYYAVIGKELIAVSENKGLEIFELRERSKRGTNLIDFRLKKRQDLGLDVYDLRNKKLSEEVIFKVTYLKSDLYAVRGEKTTFFVNSHFDKVKGFKEMEGSWEVEKQGALFLCYQEYVGGRSSNDSNKGAKGPTRMCYLNSAGKKIWEGSNEPNIQQMGYGLNLERGYSASTTMEKITYPVVNAPKKKELQKALEENFTRIGYNQRGGEFYETGYTATANHRLLEMAWQNIYTTEAGKKTHYLREFNYFDMVTGKKMRVESIFKDYNQFIINQDLKGKEVLLGVTEAFLEIYQITNEPQKEVIEPIKIPWWQLYEEIDQGSYFWKSFKPKISYDEKQKLIRAIKRDENGEKGQLVHLQFDAIYKVESKDLYYVQLYKEVAYRSLKGKQIQRSHWVYKIKEIISTDSIEVVDKILKK